MKKIVAFFILIIFPVLLKGQNNLIPNTADCSGRSLPFDFNIAEAWISNTGNDISTCSTPLAGDIDGDGIVEIFALSVSNMNLLYILDGRDGSTITTLPISGHIANGVTSNIVLCKIDGTGAIFNAGKNGTNTLFKVSSAPGVRPITFRTEWAVSGGNVPSSMPIATDFDGDGIVEFVTRGQIIDSQNGSILATLSSSSISNSFDAAFHLALDLDGDGLPEVTSGTEVYKFSRNTSPRLQLWRSLAPVASIVVQNGLSMGADVNQDGNMDLVFSDHNASIIYVWTPLTSSMVGTIAVGNTGGHSYPFVGDIDGVVINGKKYPEICINARSLLRAYTFNGTNFSLKWSMPHTDTSAATSLTLFDFNNDGIVELVYRDETRIRIFDGRPNGTINISDALYSRPCGSVTCDETPIIADVTGDGSADIIVTGAVNGSIMHPGEIMVFEGGASKWASCPPVWNQQMYSPLHVNTDLSIPTTIKMFNLTFMRADTTEVQFYNGGPMQAPYVSEESFWPINLSPDVYIEDGTIVFNSSTSVTITVTYGNAGLAVASSSTPIRYYKNLMASGQIIGTDVLGVDLRPGQFHTITKTITGLNPMPSQFYVRILDDGINFPALGAYSDCNLTNNTKSFGSFELLKTVNSQSACIDGTSIFTVKMINNTNQTTTPKSYSNIHITDSLGSGWEFIFATSTAGTIGTFNIITNKLQWDIPLLAEGDTVTLIIQAKAISAGAIRNIAWIEEMDGTIIGRENVEAYVIVASTQAPAAATISPSNPQLCDNDVTLTASVPGASSYQWFRNNIEINGATQQTYTASQLGEYRVTYFDGTCVSQISDSVIVSANCLIAVNDTVYTMEGFPVTFDVKDNDLVPPECLSPTVQILSDPAYTGTVSVNGTLVTYTPAAGYISDILRYRIYCSELSIADTATIYVIIHDKPGNIDSADCVVPFGTFQFTVQQQWSVEGAQQNTGILVGDLDNDGNPEIVAYSPSLTELVIHNGQTGAVKKTISIPSASGAGGWHPNMTAALVDADRNGMGEIIVTRSDGSILSYEADTTSGFDMKLKWTASENFDNMSITNNLPQPNVVDFNGDGIPELLVYNRIYNAVTGVLLGKTEASVTSAHAGIDRGRLTVWNQSSNFQTAADMDGDGFPDIVAGGKVYKVNFNPAKTAVTCEVIFSNPSVNDGFTAVADIDMDGYLDIVVSYTTGNTVYIDVWSPKSPINIHKDVYTSTSGYPAHSFPFIGDIDGFTHSVTNKKHPEICLVTARENNGAGGYVYAYKYTNSTTLTEKWKLNTTDSSGGTGITLFDFNNDGINELVYRDQSKLRILNGINDNQEPGLADPASEFTCASGTALEYPVIADTDGDGSANICVTCAAGYGIVPNYLRVYESATQPWAPTRPVWNQTQYEPLHINNNLTVPRLPISKNTEFNGKHPYNGALIQIPIVNDLFEPISVASDPAVVATIITDAGAGKANVCVTIENRGDRNTNINLPVALYHTDYSSVNLISLKYPGIIAPGQTINLCWNDITINTYTKILVRIQDDGTTYPSPGPFLDCDYSNNYGEAFNHTLLPDAMKKNATLQLSPPFPHNGTYSNPVSILYAEEVEYIISALNVNYNAGHVIIRDTIPPYMSYKSGSANPTSVSVGTTSTPPQRTTLEWDISPVASMATTSVSYIATLQPGVSASQPLFINTAWVTVSDTLTVPTNSTFHQGGGISVTTFSAGFGGQIYNAEEQALDYMTSPTSGVIIVPAEGYIFAGWSHDDYVSLRGDIVEAKSVITHYDTLIIYGNVELRANFEPEMYPIEYYLNGSVNSESNPVKYSIESGSITLDAPQKANDVFIGWTGSNGEDPQQTVTIQNGSVGELEYFANFLNSGRENDIEKHDTQEDKIWAVKDELYIRTSKAGSIVRIFSTEGVLQKLHTIITVGESKIKLQKGIYAVTMNNNAGKIVRIE
jgi:conserved repeat domain/Listeria/Bacterioides repeat